MAITVLITGANSGVGYAATKVFLTESDKYHVIMAGRSMEKIETAASEIKAEGIKGALSTLQLDVTDEDSISTAADQISKQFGSLDVLVNNAGISSRASNLKQSFEETFAANVIGPVLVTGAFQPLLLKSKNACIIHVSSGLGSLKRAAVKMDYSYNYRADAYRMSKCALNMFMIENNKELKDQGVRVFGLCPGLVRSNLRGTDEAQISAGGAAVDPRISGELMLEVVEGKHDADVGQVVKTGGAWEW